MDVYFKNIFPDNRKSFTGAWIKYFIEEFILAPELPFTNQGLDFRDRILWVIPELLARGHHAAPPKLESSFCRFFQKQGHFLLPLISRVWLNLLDTRHEATFKWAALTLTFFYCEDHDIGEGLKGYIISNPDFDVVALGVRELAYLITKCQFSNVACPTRRSLNNLMNILSFCFRSSTSLLIGFLAGGGVSALSRLLSGPPLQLMLAQPIESADHPVSLTIMICLDLFARCLDHPSSASEALQAGLLKFVVRAAGYYGHKPTNGEHGLDLGDMVALVLASISRLLVYPSVLRRFKRSMTRHVTEEWENMLEESHGFLSEVWESCIDNINCLDDIREDLKEPGSGLCDYKECSNDDKDVKYRCCSSCRRVIYCSYTCAKKNWPRHKAACLEASKIVKGGITVPDPIAIATFYSVIQYYVEIFSRDLDDRLRDFQDKSHSKVLPVVVLEFSHIELDSNAGYQLMNQSCFNIIDQEEAIQDQRLLPANQSQILEYRSGSEDNNPLEVVVAFFPAPWPSGAWPVVEAISVPVGRSAEGSDDDGESEGELEGVPRF
ncbi:hypothetical protein VNI00_005480 [Paramarasmius palmivorus]|uniref:MYND-type domain-containing protein n=1 Tax=Paramarasmius palmivorus TaxID=297713 RepID=A0AAW0DGN7_9AGAR